MDEARFLAARAAGAFGDGDHVEWADGLAVEGPSGLPYRYSLDDYHRAIEGGVFTSRDRIELISGELIEKMAVGERHVTCVNQINVYFVTRFAGGYICSAQNPIVLPDHSEPEPDYALYDKRLAAQFPGKLSAKSARLIVEVADSSLRYDEEVKPKIYALANIPEYWIIDLVHDRLELYTDPDVETGVYRDIQYFSKEDSFVSLLCGEVSVRELIP